MSEQNNSTDWLIFYKWQEQVFSLRIKACSQKEAEDKAVDYLIQQGRATNCRITLIIPEESF